MRYNKKGICIIYRFSIFLFITLNAFSISVYAQVQTTLQGVVSSAKGELLGGVTVHVKGSRVYTETDNNGFYEIKGISDNSIISFTRVGFKTLNLELGLISGETNNQDVILQPEIRSLEEVNITERSNGSNTINIDPLNYHIFPQPSGNFESLIKNLPGVSSKNELSSQYTVRGGNFDENLIYLNDIEISRPLLVRQGQQEGLGVINPDMVADAKFSAGGFSARYGDKLSSVLDVRYARPDSFSLQASAGLLGSSATLKVPYGNGYLLAGFRHKLNESLLGEQDIDGQYNSGFSDYQFLYKQALSNRLFLSVLGNYNKGNLQIQPIRRETEFGTSDEVLKLFVNYDGVESNSFETMMGAVVLRHAVSNTLNIKWVNSFTNMNEIEGTDLQGWYAFDERGGGLGTGAGAVLGRGSLQNFADNSLSSSLFSSELRLYKQVQRSYLEMGIRYQNDQWLDQIHEFTGTDTSGFSAPGTGTWNYENLVEQNNSLRIHRFSGFLQNTYTLNPFATIVAGMRANYNTYTDEFQLSPRVSLSYLPATSEDLRIRIALGRYVQSPGYRELRNYDGTLNRDFKIQKSWQILAGSDYNFNGLGTRLTLTSEIYLKYLNRITPYTIEDLKVRYFANQQSKGYAAGADFSISGNFARDLESVFRMSILKTEEDVENDFYTSIDEGGNSRIVYPGAIKRPTDQLLNIGILFQDRLIENPTYKVHLNLVYASALPTGRTGSEPHMNDFKIPAYKRVDIGFSKDFADPETRRKSPFIFKYFQSLSLHAEVFNLLNIKNTASYLWLSDYRNNQYAIPNYLSFRKFNFKLVAQLKSR